MSSPPLTALLFLRVTFEDWTPLSTSATIGSLWNGNVEGVDRLVTRGAADGNRGELGVSNTCVEKHHRCGRQRGDRPSICEHTLT